MANPHRGEVTVTLSGERYTMRPTFQALAQIEDETGVGLMGLLEKVRDHSVKDMAAILYHGIIAGETKIKRDKVEEAMVETGVASVVPAIVDFVGRALYADEMEKKTE